VPSISNLFAAIAQAPTTSEALAIILRVFLLISGITLSGVALFTFLTAVYRRLRNTQPTITGDSWWPEKVFFYSGLVISYFSLHAIPILFLLGCLVSFIALWQMSLTLERRAIITLALYPPFAISAVLLADSLRMGRELMIPAYVATTSVLIIINNYINKLPVQVTPASKDKEKPLPNIFGAIADFIRTLRFKIFPRDTPRALAAMELAHAYLKELAENDTIDTREELKTVSLAARQIRKAEWYDPDAVYATKDEPPQNLTISKLKSEALFREAKARVAFEQPNRAAACFRHST
jgi:hypothetical protein